MAEEAEVEEVEEEAAAPSPFEEAVGLAPSQLVSDEGDDDEASVAIRRRSLSEGLRSVRDLSLC